DGGARLAERPFATGGPGATATLLPGGNVLVAGGEDSAGSMLQSSEEYVTVLNRWLPAPALRSPRVGQTATLLQDGRVLVVGGLSALAPAATSELYPAASGVAALNDVFDPPALTTRQAQGVLWTGVQGTHTV